MESTDGESDEDEDEDVNSAVVPHKKAAKRRKRTNLDLSSKRRVKVLGQRTNTYLPLKDISNSNRKRPRSKAVKCTALNCCCMVMAAKKTNAATQCNLFHNEAYSKGTQVLQEKSNVTAHGQQTDNIHYSTKYCQTDNAENTVQKWDFKVALAQISDRDFMRSLLALLQEKNQLTDFMSLLTSLKNGKLRTDNLAWLCMLDRAKYANCVTTTQMKYRSETVEFWTSVYMLFGNSALTVFRGPANFSQVMTDKCQRGKYDPMKGICNFSVPSVPTLRKVNLGFQGKIPPGFIETTLKMGEERSAEGRQFTLSLDGKKVAEGLKNVDDGDCNLLGLEKPNLKAQLKLLQYRVDFAEDLLKLNAIEDRSVHVLKMNRAICMISRIIEKLMLSIRAKNIVQKKLQGENAGNKKSELRFKYQLSQLNVKRHECENNVRRALHLNDRFLFIAAQCQGIQNYYSQTGYFDLSRSPFCFRLVPPEYLECYVDLDNSPMYIKQGSEQWLQKRKEARITGSTMYHALGLEDFPLQQQHFETYILGLPKTFSQKTKNMMEYGRNNEINAVATVISRVQMALFPPCYRYYEQGMLFQGTAEVPKMLEVSSDGLLCCENDKDECPYSSLHVGSGKVVIEIKCPYPKEQEPHLPYEEMPKRYVTQCLAEMAVHGANTLIFVVWTPQSTAVWLVHFSADLWNEIYNFTCHLYGSTTCELPPKWLPTSKELIPKLAQFVHTHTKLLCIVPSVQGIEGDMSGLFAQDELDASGHIAATIVSCHRPIPQMVQMHVNTEEIIEETKSCAAEAKVLFQDCHNCLREPAQEVLVWMLNCKDRMQEPNVPNAAPVCYAMKGRSLTMPVARKLVEMVRNKLKERNINILCENYDAQFHPIIVRSKSEYPLTRLQLQKQSWQTTLKKKKEDVLAEMLSTSSLNAHEKEMLSASRCFIEGTHDFGNLKITIKKNPKRIWLGTNGGPNFPESVAGKWKYACLTDAQKRSYASVQQTQKRRGKVMGLQEDERNLLKAVHPDLLAEFQDVLDGGEYDSMDELGEDELPDLNEVEPPLAHILTNDKFNLLKDILNALRRYNSQKWTDKDVAFLYPSMLPNVRKLNKECIKPELQVIAKVLAKYTPGRKWYYSKEPKSFNVNLLASAFESATCLERTQRKRRTFNPQSLLLQCKKVLKKEPALSLKVSYVRVAHVFKKQEWFANATVPMYLPVPHRDVEMELFAYPEYSHERQQVECRSFDPVHVLTKVRGHVCNKGYDFASKQAFVDVACERPDIISKSVVLDHIDPQNAFIAEKLFSEKVERAIRERGYEDTAEFVFRFRLFFRALNDRGMSADERLCHLYEMGKLLLNEVSFDTFPPPYGFQYIRGMPIKTFEAILHIISNRFTLYDLAVGKTYNVRSCTTLSCESQFSDLCRCDREGYMYVKAANVSKLIARSITLNYLKHTPSKPFALCTSTKSAYPVHLAEDDQQRLHDETESDFDGVYRDHHFDYVPEKSRSRIRRTDVTTGIAPLRTCQSVRQYFRCDESKIPATHRTNFPINDI